MLGARNVHYEVAERTRGFAVGGIGVMHQMARSIGLVEAIDRHLHRKRSANPVTPLGAPPSNRDQDPRWANP